jgi:hypothetical protein
MAIGLTVIDTLHYKPSIKAINKTLDTLGDKISNIYWFSDIDYPEEKRVQTDWIQIPKIKKYNDDYGYITLRLCPTTCVEEHNLIIHSDGFAVNKDAWTDEFLEYDYIGAAWNDGTVGNGGFTLRSRKLYDALIDMMIGYKSSHYKEFLTNIQYSVFNGQEWLIPEDNIICKIHRDTLINDYGIKFAPLELANRFSVEHYSTTWRGKSLGFHGKHGIAIDYGINLGEI